MAALGLAIKKLTRRVYIHLLVGRGRIRKGAKPRMPGDAGGLHVLHAGHTPGEAYEMISARYDELFAGFAKGCRVMIKINLNTAHPYPASTDPQMLKMLVGLLREHGIKDITVADCSSNSALPTRKTFRKTGIAVAMAGRARCLGLEDESWAEVPVEGDVLKSVIVSDAIYKIDKLIYLCNLKSHVHSGYSAGIKHAMGLVHLKMRYAMHRANLDESLAELSLAVRPDVTIVDGRTVFVSGGPETGEIAGGGEVLAGCDQVAVEREAYALLYRLKEQNGHAEGFPANPDESAQISHYVKLVKEGRLH